MRRLFRCMCWPSNPSAQPCSTSTSRVDPNTYCHGVVI